MALISLLIALLVERIIHLKASLQLDELLQAYLYPALPSFQRGGFFTTLSVLLIPTIAIFGLIEWIAGWYYGLPTMLLWLVLLLMSFGGSAHRHNYRKYLKALSRHDLVAKQKYADCLEVNSADCCPTKLTEQVAQQLVWINYRFYFAVIFYFVISGPIGLTFYVAARSYYQFSNQQQQLKTQQEQRTYTAIYYVMRILDWVPSRLTIVGFALVAETRSALPTSLKAWLNIKTPEFELLGQIMYQVSQGDAPSECYNHTCYQVQLAKRNIVLFMTVISLFTINGTLI